MTYWRAFSPPAARDRRQPAAPPGAVPGGAADILYGGGWWKLGADDCLLVECEPPAARYWSFQLYSTPWFESLDMANRLVSLNCDQMQIDADGRFRLVVAGSDPGIANWLDTEGRADGDDLVPLRVVAERAGADDAADRAARAARPSPGVDSHLRRGGASRPDRAPRASRAVARRFRR